MRGRRTSEEKIQAARDLREKGFSVREIAKTLRVSKSAIQRFTEDVPLEPPPQQPETEEPPAVPANLPNRWESEMADLWGQLLDIKSAADFAYFDGDADQLRRLDDELSRLYQKGRDCFRNASYSRFGRRIEW
jgi:transposase-like protein